MERAPDSDRHRYFEELAVSHVLGGLNESDGRVFRSHLLDCPQCRARVGELRRIANDLADVERDERRVKAAKAIETKRRDDEDEAESREPVQTPRTSRVAVLVGLVLLVGLAAWNFLLRDTAVDQAEDLEAARVTTDLLIDGEDALFTSPTGQFSAPPNQVRYDDDHVVVVLDGVRPEQLYAVYLVGPDEAVVNMRPQSAGADRMTLLVPRVEGLRSVVVTQPEGLPSSRDITGTRVLVATLP